VSVDVDNDNDNVDDEDAVRLHFFYLAHDERINRKMDG